MELRHLRYFIAVAEEGSFTQAAEKRLHTAQPSLSRQIRDLETQLDVQLIERGPRGMALTPAGRVFLDHARLILAQVEAATEAARRTARSAKASFVVGFLTGYEMEWLPRVLDILRDEMPRIEITIHSSSSPELMQALRRGEIDIAFIRNDGQAHDLTFKAVASEKLFALLPAGHRLASRNSVPLRELAGDTFVNFSKKYAPALRRVVDTYIARSGVAIVTGHEAETLPTVISLVLSAPGFSLLPAYARKLLPPSVTARPLQGEAPTIDLCLCYNGKNLSPLAEFLLSRADDLAARAAEATA